MILYADSSAIVKLYIEEQGSANARRQMSDANLIACSYVAYAEIRATLAAAARQGRHTKAEHIRATADFEARWVSLHRIELSESLLRLAGELVEEHPLRGFDAIHLASALTLQRELGEPVSFSAFDSRLTTAAAVCGLALA